MTSDDGASKTRRRSLSPQPGPDVAPTTAKTTTFCGYLGIMRGARALTTMDPIRSLANLLASLP